MTFYSGKACFLLYFLNLRNFNRLNLYIQPPYDIEKKIWNVFFCWYFLFLVNIKFFWSHMMFGIKYFILNQVKIPAKQYIYINRKKRMETRNNYYLNLEIWIFQCLGSGSIGSSRFWLTGSAKICGSTDPDPRGKLWTKNCKKNCYSQNPKLN